MGGFVFEEQDGDRVPVARQDVGIGAANGAGTVQLARTPGAGAVPVIETCEVSLTPTGWRVVVML